jgi:hypothetical protein
MQDFLVVPYQGQQHQQQQTYAQKVQQRPHQTQVYNPVRQNNQYQGNSYNKYQNASRNYATNNSYRQNNSYVARQYTPNRCRGGYRGRARRTYNFRRDKQDIILNFYKCEMCPNMHPDGTACNTPKQQQNTLNGQ